MLPNIKYVQKSLALVISSETAGHHENFNKRSPGGCKISWQGADSRRRGATCRSVILLSF